MAKPLSRLLDETNQKFFLKKGHKKSFLRAKVSETIRAGAV